jgi:glycosyltransferase involved in cell wall biosynthesis
LRFKVFNIGGRQLKKTKSLPLVSVIIPAYNRGWIIRDAIDSALNQKVFREFEVIVVDDGSIDDTPEILRSYQDRIMVLNQSNRGVSAARNKGVDAASGELIAFLDSDDKWLPQKLLVQVDFFSQHPDALICQTDELWIRNQLRINPKKRHKKPSGDIFESSLRLCLVSPSAVMMKKKLFYSVGRFDESLPACEDYDLWLRIGCRHPVYLIGRQLVVKRGGHPDQLSAARGLDQFRIRSLSKILDSGILNPMQSDAAVKTLADKCAVYSLGCRKRGRIDEAGYYHRLTQKYLKSADAPF